MADPAINVSAEGLEQFQALAERIKVHADQKALRKELYAGLNRVTKQLRTDMKAAIPSAVPRRGGLAALVSQNARLSGRTSSSGTNTGVRIVASSKRGQLANLNAGKLRHPVYGHQPWITQTRGITPHFLDEKFEGGGAEARREVIRVMEEVARKVAG